MNKEELQSKAHDYALKVLEDEIARIENAYIEGYEAGKKESGFQPIVKEGNIEWVDMSLPSGTLWSRALLNDSGTYLLTVFNQAKDYDLPTKEDIDELLCQTNHGEPLWNGDQYYLSRDGIRYYMEKGPYWLKGVSDEKMQAPIFYGRGSCSTKFMGDKAKVILVKHPNNK